MRYTAACASDTGLIRRNNEDNFFFGGQILPENHGSSGVIEGWVELDAGTDKTFSAAVFDGMGGQADGQTASYIAALVYQKCLGFGCSPDRLGEFLAASVTAMNRSVVINAKKTNARMGTTAAILCLSAERSTVCSVGDSRVFLLRGRELTQLTVDHTDAELLIRLGIADRKPRLTQYIGMYADGLVPEPYIADMPVEDGDRYLICSDGVTDMLPKEELARLLGEAAAPRESVEALLRAALDRGGRDNVTAVVVHAEAPEREE